MSAVLQHDLPQLLAVLLSLVLSSGVVGTLAYAVYSAVVAKLPANVQPVIRDIVKTVVWGVEQRGAAQALSGAEKKQIAVTDITSILARLKVSAPDGLVDHLIEAAVLEVNQLAHGQPASPPPPDPSAASQALHAAKRAKAQINATSVTATPATVTITQTDPPAAAA